MQTYFSVKCFKMFLSQNKGVLPFYEQARSFRMTKLINRHQNGKSRQQQCDLKKKKRKAKKVKSLKDDSKSHEHLAR